MLEGCLKHGSCLMPGADSRVTGSATEKSWHLPATRGRFWTVMYKIDSESWGGWPLVAQHGLKRTECLRTHNLVVAGSSPARPTKSLCSSG